MFQVSELYDIYDGGENLKKITSELNAKQKNLNSEVIELANELNALKQNATVWYPIRTLSYFVMLILALLNSFLGLLSIKSGTN